MQVRLLGAERRQRWSYDEKVRLVEETLQAGETVSDAVPRHGIAHSLLFSSRRRARRGSTGQIMRLLLFPSRSHCGGYDLDWQAGHNRCPHRLHGAQGLEI